MRKIVSLFVAGLVSLTVFFTGCGTQNKSSDAGIKAEGSGSKIPANMNESGLPIAKEAVTLKFAGIRGAQNTVPFSEMPVLKDIEAKTNVKIVWDEIDTSAKSEKVNLMFASNALPDAFYGQLLTDAQVVTFSALHSIVELDGLIEKYAPDISSFMKKRPDYKKVVTTPDGRIYSLAALLEEERGYAPDNMFINKAWLDKLGLKPPETSEDFYKALKAFKENDLNGNGKKDEIPFSYSEKYHSIHSLFGMFGLPDNSLHMAVKGGKVICTAVQPEYKEAVKYFNRLFTEGLVDEEAFTQQTAQLKAKGSSNSTILGSAMCFWLDDIMPQDKQKDYVHLLPMKGPKGDQLWGRRVYMPGLIKNSFSITSANKNPEITMRWLDYSMDDGERSLIVSHGLENGGWKYEDKQKGLWRTLNEQAPTGMTFGQYRHSMCPGANAVFILSADFTNKRVLDVQNKAQNDRYLAKKPYLVSKDNVLPDLYLTAEEQSEVSSLAADISSYIEQFRAEWLTKGGIDGQWESYMNKLKSLKLDRMLEIYQKAFERGK